MPCCFGDVPEDEPVFLIRGKDLLAADVVSDWITRAEMEGLVPADKINRAKEHLQVIIEFQREHPDRCKFPD